MRVVDGGRDQKKCTRERRYSDIKKNMIMSIEIARHVHHVCDASRLRGLLNTKQTHKKNTCVRFGSCVQACEWALGTDTDR